MDNIQRLTFEQWFAWACSDAPAALQRGFYWVRAETGTSEQENGTREFYRAWQNRFHAYGKEELAGLPDGVYELSWQYRAELGFAASDICSGLIVFGYLVNGAVQEVFSTVCGASVGVVSAADGYYLTAPGSFRIRLKNLEQLWRAMKWQQLPESVNSETVVVFLTWIFQG